MALSKLQLCLNEIRLLSYHLPVSPLLRGRTKSLKFGGLPFSLTNRHLRLKINDRRQYSAETRPPRTSLLIPATVTKDRLYLLGFGVLIVGCLVAWEKTRHTSRQHKEGIKKLHSTVLTAQNAVKEGKYEEAIEHYRNARIYVDQCRMSSESAQNKVILNIVDQLGHLTYELGNFEEAEKFLKETETVMLQCGIEEDDDSYVEVMMRLASIDSVNGRKEEALEKYNFCITTLEKKISVQEIYCDEYSDRLTLYGMALTAFGTYTKQLGLLDASERAFSKALNVCRSVLGPNHEQTSVLANDLATVYDEKGKLDKAIRLAEKAIKIASETAPGNLATYKYNLAHILMHKGEDSRARNALREALHLAEENEDRETKQLAESSIMKLEVDIS